MTHAMAAEFALDRGDAQAASRDYAQAALVSADPKVAETSARLAMNQGDRDGATKAIQRMHETGADAASLARERARLALLRGHRSEAEDQLKIVLAGNDEAAWREFARLLTDARDPALAGAILEKLANPETLPADDGGIWVAMSQLGEKLNRHLYAEKLATTAAERFATAPAYAWAAHLKLAAGNDKEAMALFDKALGVAPDNTRLRMMYAAALGKTGNDRGALKVLAAGQPDFDLLAARAAYAARLNDDAELQRVYDLLKKDRAKISRDSSFLLGQLAEILNKGQEALEWYRKVPDGDENAFDAGVRRAVLLDQGGHAGQAHELAGQLQRDYADDPDQLRQAYLLDAQLYLNAGQPDAAIKAYDRGLEALPDDTGLLYGRALSQADHGDGDAAVADLRKVLKLKPDDVEAMNALGYTLADQNRDLDEAGKLLDQALAKQPDEPAVVDSWGWLQYRLGHFAVAEKALRKAWKAQQDPDIGAHLGEVLWVNGQRDEARTIFRQVSKEHPGNATLKKTLQRLKVTGL